MRLLQHLPNIYHNGGAVTELQSAIATQSELVEIKIQDCLPQMFVETAVATLGDWERYLGIVARPHESNDNRRGQIKSALRGHGTTTVDMIKNSCMAYSGGEVEIIEHYDTYTFVIKFVGQLGIPNNMNHIKRSIDKIKPAHLAYLFEFTYNTHDTLALSTHNQLSSYSHEGLRSETIHSTA